MHNSRLVLISFWLCLTLAVRTNIKLTSNFEATAVHSFASIALPMQVHLNIPRSYDPNPISHTPINEKYAIGLHRPMPPNLELPGLQQRMVHIDYQMIYEQNPPTSVFQDKYSEQYHLLQIREFYITMANPSELYTICINEIFSDCDSIKKMLKKPLPICINPFTKYPIYFNLYVTHFKNRELIKSSIFFNVTFKYENQVVFNRVWMREVKFNLMPNHLKLAPFEIKCSENQNGYVMIKNHQKFDLSFLVIHKFKKYHANGQPLDDKFTIGSQKTFRFMLEAKDSTMTIYSKPVENSDRSFPVLYVPVYCLDKAVIENVPIGIIYSNRVAFTFPIWVTSHTNSLLLVEEISLTSTSCTVELIRSPAHKMQIQSIEKYAQIASFIVRSALKSSFKNSITIKVRLSLGNSQSSNSSFEIKRTMTYSELYGAIEVGQNRYYEISKLPDREYNDTEKIRHFNYSIVNKMQIPIRMERILFSPQKFRMHWFRYTGMYIFPERVKEEIMLQYIGPKQIPISPIKYAATIEFSGNIFVPFEILVFDRTLGCIYQGKETRCSNLKYINFGYQKNQQKLQTQTIIFINFNPHNITISLKNLKSMAASQGLQLSAKFSQPFPLYENYFQQATDKAIIELHTGHYINLIIEMRITGKPLSGETLLQISTEYESFSPKIKFNFQQGRLHFTPATYKISHFDRQHHGELQLLSTFQDVYQIREIISDTNSLQFFFNESHEYEPNQKIDIPFTYNPYRDENNLTSQCCAEDFLNYYYLHSLIYYEESNAWNHEVTIITNNGFQQQLNIKVDIHKANLLSAKTRSKKVVLSAISIGNKARICLQIENPYPTTLKYKIYFIPDAVIYKPKDYIDYFKHARKEKVDTYICFTLNKRTSQLVNALKGLFKLDETPMRIEINVDSMGNIDFDSNERDNLSSNEYVNSIVQTGEEACYKINTFVYFKLLIESEIVNALLENYSLEIVEKFIEKEWNHMHNSSISFINDEFYNDLKLKFQDYCNTAFFPIFRFCLHYPIQLQRTKRLTYENSNETNIKQNQSNSYYLASKQTQEMCFNINSQFANKKQNSFQLVIANNYSKYDDYKIQLSVIQPKLLVGDIAFERTHRINHQTFIKHYFSAFAKASTQDLLSEGIQNKHNIIPIYLTNQDYEEQFGLFKGERYFQIQNQSPMDIAFTHFGFENKENISQWSGLTIEKVDSSGTHILLPKNMKTVFKLSLLLDKPFEFNLSNPYFHKKINLYLYKDDQFYLSLTLLLRVADNVFQKLKVNQEPQEAQRNKFGYLFLNFISFAYICIVMIDLKREETEKQKKMQSALQKQKKIVPHVKEIKEEKSDVGFIQQKLKRKNHLLLPESIGFKLKVQQQHKYIPHYIISEEELTFFKSLKIEKDKSVISQSSDEPILRFATEQTEKIQERSQSNERDSHEHEESNHNSSLNDPLEHSELQSQGSQQSLSESILPDGISVCNDQLDTLDEFEDFGFGFEPKRSKKEEKVKNEEEFVYYDVFSNHNPLKKEKQESKDPFPWMNQNQKKKHRPKRIKKEQI